MPDPALIFLNEEQGGPLKFAFGFGIPDRFETEQLIIVRLAMESKRGRVLTLLT